MRRCKPGCFSGYTHSNSQPLLSRPTLQQWSIYPKLVFQIPCTPTLGILHNQLSTLPCIFKPKFIPSKHKWASFTTTISYTRTKDFCLWTKDYLNPKTLSTLSYFIFLSSCLSQVLLSPFQSRLLSALPNTIYTRVASVFSHSKGPKMFRSVPINSQAESTIIDHFPLLKSLSFVQSAVFL